MVGPLAPLRRLAHHREVLLAPERPEAPGWRANLSTFPGSLRLATFPGPTRRNEFEKVLKVRADHAVAGPVIGPGGAG